MGERVAGIALAGLLGALLIIALIYFRAPPHAPRLIDRDCITHPTKWIGNCG